VFALTRRVRLALQATAVVRSWARPVRWSNLLFSRYGQGQEYGLHTDDAVICDEDGWPLRTDISFTLFLSDPDSYEGGALLIRDAAGDREFRPRAGSAVFYPTGQIHCVSSVTRGSRLACVGWMQSLVRRADQREILFDLEQLSNADAGDRSLLLDKTIGNLLRMWGEH
jgi:PKHD-type hydroxylase